MKNEKNNLKIYNEKLNIKIIVYGIVNAIAFMSGILAIYFIIVDNGLSYLSLFFWYLLFTLRVPIVAYRNRKFRSQIDKKKTKLYEKLSLVAFIAGVLGMCFLVINNESSILSNIFGCLLCVIQLPEETYRYKKLKK